MQRRWFVGVAVVFVVLAVGTTVPVYGVSGDADTVGQTQDPNPPQVETPDRFDSTTFQLTVYANGSTTWTIIHSTVLDNESERDDFEAFASRFNSTETGIYTDFKTRARALAAFGSRATERRMNATNFQKGAQVEQRPSGLDLYGTVEMSFLWTNFSQPVGDRVIVGDVFQGGMYVGPDQRLVFERGPGLRFSEEVDPDPDGFSAQTNLTASESIGYTGEQEFGDRLPRVVFVQSDQSVPTSSTTPTTRSPDGAAPSAAGPLPIVAAILLLLIIGGAIAWYSGSLEGVGRDGDTAETTAATTAEPESTNAATTEPAVPEEELLSDEDRVLRLLDQNGGRMKQVDIVDSTEWSKSKVSMLLSEMEDDGAISKLRVGRENIISKAGEEPDAVGSPFEDE